MQDKICIYHHLGLGDTFECNGMIRYYAKSYSQVDIFAKSNYHDMVCYMYRDNPCIVVNKIDGNNETLDVSRFLKNYKGDILFAGHQKYFSNLEYFKKNKMGPGESFYFLANVPWEKRNTDFFFQRDREKENDVYKKLNPNNEKYVFIHDDISRGFYIDLRTEHNIIRNDNSINMFHLIKLLEEAEEIHCMSSSILCLIDCLSSQIQFKKLFLHHNIRKIELGPNSLFADWNII